MTDAPRRSGTSFRVLRRRDFALCWSASLVSATGGWMQNVAVPFVIYQMTGSTTWLGFAAFMSFFPSVLGGPLGGSLADRHSRRRILVLTQVLMAACALAMWTVWVAGVATPGIMVGIVFLLGFFGGINISTWQAFVTQLVDADELIDAVRLNSMQFTGARAFGPALAALVLSTLGPSAAFMANALTYFLVIGALLMVRPRPQVYSEERHSLVADLLDGLDFVRRRRGLALPMVMIGVASLLGTSVIQLAPALADDIFHVGRGAYGLLVAAYGVGSVIGTVSIAVVADHFLTSSLARYGVFGLALGVVALGLAPVYGVGAVAMAGMGLTYVLLTTSLQTSIQTRVDDRYRGRTMAVYTSSLLLGVPIGALVQGALATTVDLRVVVVASGVLLFCFATYSVLRYQRLRLLDTSGPDDVVDVSPRRGRGLSSTDGAAPA